MFAIFISNFAIYFWYCNLFDLNFHINVFCLSKLLSKIFLVVGKVADFEDDEYDDLDNILIMTNC